MRNIQTSRSTKNWVRLFLALQCAMACQIAQAGSYGINPVKLTLSGQNSTQIMTVRNDGAEAAVMQVELAAWSQTDARDIYTPTRELLANPPIFTLPAGAEQVIRVGLRRAPDGQRELAYRLFLQEVPPPVRPDTVGLQVALRISVPVFVPPPHPVKPILHWQATRIAEHTLKVGVTNTGNGHDHIAAYKIYRAGSSAPFLSQQLFAYLLPGETHYWTVTTDVMPNPGEALRVLANTETGSVQGNIVMDKP
ncbi:MAG: fimbria/pilus periplasmic chaperone [Methylobacter sp.]|nr:fimbria/pilus periplasmic chaperone [Methylobacter sp.]